MSSFEFIVDQIKNSDACDYAADHYEAKYPNEDLAEKILERGSADFDQKYDPDDEKEKTCYRSDFYVRCNLKMHFSQARRALSECFKDALPQPLLFVDFGCGPMTAGLSLASILPEQTNDTDIDKYDIAKMMEQKKAYKKETSYIGIDASENMLRIAENINREHGLFDQFELKQGKQLDVLSDISCTSSMGARTAVLMLSFVLAPKTLKGEQSMEDLANHWTVFVQKSECDETYIIYLNPAIYPTHKLHKNYRVFEYILQSSSNDFEYRNFGLKEIVMKNKNSRDFALGLIRGQRQQ